VALDPTRPALDLDEPEAFAREDQGINLIDGPVARLELEVGPGAERVLVGQAGAHEIQGTTLVLELRGCQDLPVGGHHGHYLPPRTRAGRLVFVATAAGVKSALPLRTQASTSATLNFHCRPTLWAGIWRSSSQR